MSIAAWDNCSEEDMQFIIISDKQRKKEIQTCAQNIDVESDCYTAPFVVGIEITASVSEACAGVVAGQFISSLKACGVWTHVYFPSESSTFYQAFETEQNLFIIICCGYPVKNYILPTHNPDARRYIR